MLAEVREGPGGLMDCEGSGVDEKGKAPSQVHPAHPAALLEGGEAGEWGEGRQLRGDGTATAEAHGPLLRLADELEVRHACWALPSEVCGEGWEEGRLRPTQHARWGRSE